MTPDWRTLLLAPRALVELARARLELRQIDPAELTAAVSMEGDDERSREWPEDVARVAWLIPRVAACLPWRSDCLVQALAARRWLARLGHGSRLHLGSKLHAGRLDAHAWLTCRGGVVTGGRIDDFARFRL